MQSFDPSALIPFGIVIVAILVVVALIFGVINARKRRKALSQWASGHHLDFDPAHDASFDQQFDFPCLHQGHSRYAYNCATGIWNHRTVTCFDYHYTVGSGKNRSDHRFSAVVLEPDIPLKPLLIRHENMLDKVAGFLGHEDINFESAAFSRQFFVKSQDRKWAYDVLSAQTIEFLLQSPHYSIAFDASRIIAWRSSCFNIPEFEQAIGVIEGVLDRLPDYVVQQQQQNPVS